MQPLKASTFITRAFLICIICVSTAIAYLSTLTLTLNSHSASTISPSTTTPKSHLHGSVSIPIPISNSSSHSHSAHSDCLIIILGQTRAHKLTWPSFQRYVLNETHCDLALCVGTNDEDQSNPFYHHAKYVWQWNETHGRFANDSEAWTNAFQYLYNVSMQYFPQRLSANHRHKWLDRVYHAGNDNIRIELGPTANQPGSGGIQLFFRLFAYLNIVELGLVTQYKYMMHTRSDYNYLCEFPLMRLTRNKTETDTLWISSGRSYGGITDRNLLAPTRLFMSAMDILLAMFMEYEQWNEYLVEQGVKQLNVEAAIKAHFILKGIEDKVRHYEQPMFAVRENETWTRWERGVWSEAQQLFVKYPLEYVTALKVCNMTL